MEKLRPGLYRWTAEHPDWTPEEGGPDGWDREVASYLYESPEGLVLFDPLVGDDETWRALDERVAGHGPAHVLLTIFWHVRSTPAVAERYPRTRVWAFEREPWLEMTRERVGVTDVFGLDARLPGGIEAREPREVVFWVPEHRALVAGDVLLPDRAGGIRVTPWLEEGQTPEEMRALVRPLLELPIELVLLTHGEAVEDGRAALARALEA
jgi:glyoxylase-like metal-dependent hydrolase (beta-lactamase superfamily II)